MSAQVDDPRDLAAPRGESPADIESRMRALAKVRTGADPSTQWTRQGHQHQLMWEAIDDR